MDRQSNSHPLFAIIFGLIIILIGLFIVTIFSQTHDLWCSRVEPSLIRCTRESKLFGLYHLNQTEFENISGAILDENCDEDGCSCRVELQTEAGLTPLNMVYFGGIGGCEQQQDKVDVINTFLADSTAVDAAIPVTTSEQLMTFLPLIFVIFGLFILLNGFRHLWLKWA